MSLRHDGPAPQPDPRAGRQAALVTFLRAAEVAVAALGVADVLAPPPWKERLAVVMVGALVAIPATRVLWLTARWTAKGDRRFALAGVALVAVMVSGLVLA